MSRSAGVSPREPLFFIYPLCARNERVQLESRNQPATATRERLVEEPVMSLRESDGPATVSPAPLTRRELREREEAARSAQAKTIFSSAVSARPQPARPRASAPHQAHARANSAVSSPPRAAKHHTGSRLLSLGALLFAGTLLVAASVPANAFMSDASTLAPSVQVNALEGQSLVVAGDVVAPGLTRDGYSVTSYAQLLRLRYGNSGTYTATTGAIRWPFPYSVPFSDGFGLRDASISGIAFHKGVDFNPGGGSPIYAIADGVVTTAVDGEVGLGTHVIIQHNIAGQNIESVYAHMRLGSSPLRVGDVIKVGDFIGLVGETGVSTGEHLHFEIHLDGVPVDPFAWLTENAVN